MTTPLAEQAFVHLLRRVADEIEKRHGSWGVSSTGNFRGISLSGGKDLPLDVSVELRSGRIDPRVMGTESERAGELSPNIPPFIKDLVEFLETRKMDGTDPAVQKALSEVTQRLADRLDDVIPPEEST